MHTIKLNIQDSIYEHIMFLLNGISSKSLEIIEDKAIAKKTYTKDSIDLVFDTVNLDMKDFKFNREEANAR